MEDEFQSRRKRPRDADETSDTEDNSSSDDSGEEPTVELGESLEVKPVHELLIPLLRYQRPSETVARTLTRIEKDIVREKQRSTSSNTAATSASRTAFDVITANVQSALLLHELCVLDMSRESLLLRAHRSLLMAKRETEGKANALPKHWVLQWSAAFQEGLAVHGPFDADEMEGWREKGFFTKKPCVALNANEVDKKLAVWTNGAIISSFK